MKQLLAFLLLMSVGLCFSLSASAVLFEPDQDYGAEYLDWIPQAPKGAIDWKTLFSIDEEEVVADDGYAFYKPVFSPAVKALSGQRIQVKGFMFPMDMTEMQQHFLLSAFPPSCPFHAPGGPRHIIEAFAKEGIEFSYDAVLIEGTLELIELDEENGLYYRFSDARLIDEQE